MKSLRILVMFAAAAMFAGAPRLLATPLPTADQHHGTKAFDDGYKHGHDDAKHHRSAYPKSDRWKHDDERSDYAAGYEAGYRAVAGSYAYSDTDHPVLPNGAYANTDPRDIGYQDGRLDGENDRNSGRSFRPTDADNYKHADRGYTDPMGSKDVYKAAYREGYARGYREGFGKH